MPHHKHAATPPATADGEHLGLERIVFFSDAVMAIAITLLALDLKVPERPPTGAVDLPAALSALTPRIISFVISFVVIGIYWSSHHRYFGYIRRFDRPLMVLNLVFLFLVISMPFVTSLLGQFSDAPLGVMIYAAAVGATGMVIAMLWWYASHGHRLIDAALDDGFIQWRGRMALLVPLVFLASIPVAWFSPHLAMSLWWVAPLVAWAGSRWFNQHHAAARPLR